MKKKKGRYVTSNIYRSLKGTAYVRYSTKKHPMGAGRRKVIFRKKKKKSKK